MFVLFTDIIQPKVECLQKAPTTTPNSSLIVSQRKERERERERVGTTILDKANV